MGRCSRVGAGDNPRSRWDRCEGAKRMRGEVRRAVRERQDLSIVAFICLILFSFLETGAIIRFQIIKERGDFRI
jgi:hypothetical protein